MRTILAGSLFALITVAGTVDAHIHLTTPLSRTDDVVGDPQKEQHCGSAAQGRNPARVTEFQPGATITVTWAETIQHPGYFRIAFQPNGEVFGIPPARPGLCKGNIACPPGVANCDMPSLMDTEEGAGPGGSIVLKDRIADGTLSTQVTLPNMECTNCTLQFIQVMTDKCPYTVDALSDDIYFNCADITLSNTGAGRDAGTTSGEVGGGCAASRSMRWPIGIVFGCLFFRRRRR
jgi:hypothetical protein